MATKYVVNDKLVPKGYQQIAAPDLATARGITPPQGARVAIIQAIDEDVRWRDDGVDPTTTVGIILGAGRDMFYTGDLARIKFIELAASAELNISYYE